MRGLLFSIDKRIRYLPLLTAFIFIVIVLIIFFIAISFLLFLVLCY